MYPLNVDQPYPRNQWWVGAMSHEVGRTLMQRTILGEPIVFYRTQAGDPVAMYGLCPHRLYPLALSTLQGDAIQCGYHGFTFDCTGSCIKVPSQSDVSKSFKSRIYPTVEKGEWIWIWTGDAALADSSKIPEPPGVFKDGWDTNVARLATNSFRYPLLIDNLLDLTHLGFIHASIVGDVNVFVQTPGELVEGNGQLSLVRDAKDMPWGPFGDFMFGADGSKTYDTRQVSQYYGPCMVITGGPFTQRADDSPTGHARELGTMWFLHLITPETPTSTHYFGGISRNYRRGDEAYSRMQLHNYESVRQQDLVALSALEPNVDRFACTRKELSARQDAGAIRVRRLLTEQIKSESTIAAVR
jgi:phenylpropionate dioxygenase-like ring-hydroxylating dioxygenase large terminal subunit